MSLLHAIVREIFKEGIVSDRTANLICRREKKKKGKRTEEKKAERKRLVEGLKRNSHSDPWASLSLPLLVPDPSPADRGDPFRLPTFFPEDETHPGIKSGGTYNMQQAIRHVGFKTSSPVSALLG